MTCKWWGWIGWIMVGLAPAISYYGLLDYGQNSFYALLLAGWMLWWASWQVAP